MPWLRPDHAVWWMAFLFAAGSTLFLVAALAALFSSADWIGVCFFAGSIFFTSASLVQLIAAAEVVRRRGRPPSQRRRLRPRAWLPARVDRLSAAIQLPGTVLFNVNTFDAMDTALDTQQNDIRVWVPDAVGSACFLVSSVLSFANAEHRWLSWRPGDLDWWIAALNLAGSIGFGISAIAAFGNPPSGDSVGEQIANAGTAAGALCFLFGALLLIPQAERQERRAGDGRTATASD